MKALILAAGYATRLYPLTQNTAKPLLEIGNKKIIEHILEEIEKVKDINEVYVITNEKFYSDFLCWSKYYKSPKTIKIINDQTKSNEGRLGAVGDLDYFISKENINEDLLVIAGDNLFGFSLEYFVNFYNQNNNENNSIVAFHDLKDKEKVKNKYGVGILNDQKVIDFEEKPSNPKSSMASTACYLFNKKDLCSIKELVKQENYNEFSDHSSQKKKRNKLDNMGELIKRLIEKSNVNGFVFEEHWFDVGSFESLNEAKETYEK